MAFGDLAANLTTGGLFLLMAAAAFVGTSGVAAVLFFGGRLMARLTFAAFLKRLLTDPYLDNLLEVLSTTAKVGPAVILETSLRAEEGRALNRPFGTRHQLPHFDRLRFDFAQLDTFPTPGDQEVDLRTVIGPQAARPLTLDFPVMIAPMAYGLALSGPVKVALAKGAALAGTASATGEGPFFPAEREAARYLVVQYGRSPWTQLPAVVRQGDAVELEVGSGARGGLGTVEPPDVLDENLRTLMGIPPGQAAMAPARFSGLATVDDLRQLIGELRELTGGVPVGVKLSAGAHLEDDLALVAEAGADFVTVGGAQAGTWQSPLSLQDDFGVPTLYALARAARFLDREGLRGRMSLIIGGNLRTPGEFLKAVALGADAVYIGTVALLALVHTQVLKTLPGLPPTQLIGYRAKLGGRFDQREAVRSLANFLVSCREEMGEGLRALGKTSLSQLTREDLMAVDPVTARACGVRPAYRPARSSATPRRRATNPPPGIP
ncbi:MAG: FMN-binding glutamate synthase family protein [Chitinophagales bacterium]